MSHLWSTSGAFIAALLSAGLLHAQSDDRTAEQAPSAPGETRVDVAPLPAHERDSIGAVVLGDVPVLAQREQLRELRKAQLKQEHSERAPPARGLQRVGEPAQPEGKSSR